MSRRHVEQRDLLKVGRVLSEGLLCPAADSRSHRTSAGHTGYAGVEVIDGCDHA